MTTHTNPQILRKRLLPAQGLCLLSLVLGQTPLVRRSLARAKAAQSVDCNLKAPTGPNPVPEGFDWRPLAEDWCGQLERCGYPSTGCVDTYVATAETPDDAINGVEAPSEPPTGPETIALSCEDSEEAAAGTFDCGVICLVAGAENCACGEGMYLRTSDNCGANLDAISLAQERSARFIVGNSELRQPLPVPIQIWATISNSIGCRFSCGPDKPEITRTCTGDNDIFICSDTFLLAPDM